MLKVDRNNWSRIIGKSILLASVQVAFGGVEMSSKYSVLNFSKDQTTLQNAANALTSYIIVGTFWLMGCSLIMFSNYGLRGLCSAIITNILIMTWIIWSYKTSFKEAAKKYGLE